MIKINLARQLQETEHLEGPTWAVPFVLGTLLVLGLGMGSWWWTDSLRQQLETIRSDKHRMTQQLFDLQTQLNEREGHKAENEHFLKVVDNLGGHEDKKWPTVLLNGISQGVGDLRVWLERVEMRHDHVDVRGKSLRVEDIGKFLDALEERNAVKSLPFVEIIDPPVEGVKVYSFRIKFPIKPVGSI